MKKILVADDEHSICQAFSDFLVTAGYTPLVAGNGEEVLEIMRDEMPEMIFLDVQMPGMNGLEVLAEIREEHPEIPVVIMTAFGTMHTAIEAVRLGAFDYLGKPLELSQIRQLLKNALDKNTQQNEFIALPETSLSSHSMVGQSAVMQEIFKLIGLVTTNDLNVLITGESGVGKELVARAIQHHSDRNQEPFVAVNCAAIPENLIENELFGHEKGAFTGADGKRTGRLEAAERGIIFLDEISELPFHLQGKLLRVLQEKTFERVGSVTPVSLRARVIAASNKDLMQEVEKGKFREDLYHRLNLVNLRIPPLRDRGDDVVLLARHFLHRSCVELNRKIREIDKTAMEILKECSWPGNVRELENTIKRSVLMARGISITASDLQMAADNKPIRPLDSNEMYIKKLSDSAISALRAMLSVSGDNSDSVYQALVTTVEYSLIDEALKISGNNQVAASRMLGLHRTTLRNKLSEKMAGSKKKE